MTCRAIDKSVLESARSLEDVYSQLGVLKDAEGKPLAPPAFIRPDGIPLESLPYLGGADGKDFNLSSLYDGNKAGLTCVLTALKYDDARGAAIDKDLQGKDAAAVTDYLGKLDAGDRRTYSLFTTLNTLEYFRNKGNTDKIQNTVSALELSTWAWNACGKKADKHQETGAQAITRLHALLGLSILLQTEAEVPTPPTPETPAAPPENSWTLPSWSWIALGGTALSIFTFFLGKWTAPKPGPTQAVPPSSTPPPSPAPVKVEVNVSSAEKSNPFGDLVSKLDAPKTEAPSALAAAASQQPAFKATFWMGRDPGANGVALNMDSAIPGSSTLIGRKQVAIQREGGSYYAVDEGKNTGLVTVKRSGGSFPMSRDANAPTALVVGDVINVAGVEKVFTNSADPASAFQDSNGVHLSHSLVGTLANPLAEAANGISSVQAPTEDAIRGAILTELPSHMFAPDGKTLASGYETHVQEMLDEAKKGGALTSANLTDSVRDVVYERLAAWSVDASLEAADKTVWKKAAEEIRDRKLADALKTTSGTTRR